MSNKRPIDHPEAQAFAQSIRDNPDDHTPRLVYADWLDENGFPDHANEVRGDVERPYGRDDKVRVRARRGVMLHQAGVDPVNGWKSEEIYSSANPEEWEPHFGHIIDERGAGQELIDAMVDWLGGSHRIVKGDPASIPGTYHDENTGYVVGHVPRHGILFLNRRVA